MQSVYSWGKYLTETVGTVVSATASYAPLATGAIIPKAEANGNPRERKNSLNPKDHEGLVTNSTIPMCLFCRNALVPDKDPRFLDCGHVFCRACLTDVEYSGVINCPLNDCKNATILREDGIDGLRSFFVNEPIANLQQSTSEHFAFMHQEEEEEEIVEEEEDDEPIMQPFVQPIEPLSFVDVPLDTKERKKVKRKVVKHYSIPLQPEPVKKMPENSPPKFNGFDEEDDEPIITRKDSLKSGANNKAVNLSSSDDDFVVLDTKTAHQQEKILTPKFYIPFTQKKEICKTLVHKWLSEIWFAPADLEEKIVIDEPRPVYVPFYYFTAKTITNFTIEIGTTTPEGVVEWRSVSDSFSNMHGELMTCASHSSNPALVKALLHKPGAFSLHTNKILPSDAPVYRASLPIPEEKFAIDISVEEAFRSIDKKPIEQAEKEYALSKINTQYKPERTRNLLCSTQLDKDDQFAILLPIYFGSFSYRGTVYEFVISGNKGLVEGNRPIGTGWLGKQWRGAMQTVTSLMHDQLGLHDKPKS